MCGIVGLFIKDPALEPELGRLAAGMLATMSDRGPDSAGFAVYGEGDDQHTKLTLRASSAAAMKDTADKIGRAFSAANIALHDTHAVVSVEDESLPQLTEWLVREAPQIELVGKGHRMEVYKEVGRPEKVAERFNLAYGERYALRLPEHVTSADDAENTMPGLDGRKMSKSYDNTIPLLAERDTLRRLVRRLKTDSTPVEEPKDPDSSTLFAIYRQFADEPSTAAVRERLLAGGLGWGEMKDILFEQLDAVLSEPRERYRELMSDRAALDGILARGGERARERAAGVLAGVRGAIGIDPS